MDETFDSFLATIDAKDMPFILDFHKQLTERGCKCTVKPAKSGMVVSYTYGKGKKTLFNYVSRKSGMKARLYTENVSEYQDIIDSLPEGMKKEIRKASDCKRLHNLADCNSRCPMGYVFTIDGEVQKKCRYMAFMPTLNDKNNPYIREIVFREIECREG